MYVHMQTQTVQGKPISSRVSWVTLKPNCSSQGEWIPPNSPVTNIRYQTEAAGKTYLVVIDRRLDPKFQQHTKRKCKNQLHEDSTAHFVLPLDFTLKIKTLLKESVLSNFHNKSITRNSSSKPCASYDHTGSAGQLFLKNCAGQIVKEFQCMQPRILSELLTTNLILETQCQHPQTTHCREVSVVHHKIPDGSGL